MPRPGSRPPLLLVPGALLLSITAAAGGQQAPPIAGVTATLALEGTVDRTYDGAHTIVVKAADGIEHLFHVTKRTVVHGATEADTSFEELTAGSRSSVRSLTISSRSTGNEVSPWPPGNGRLHPVIPAPAVAQTADRETEGWIARWIARGPSCLSFGVGLQIAVSQFHPYSNRWMVSARLPF